MNVKEHSYEEHLRHLDQEEFPKISTTPVPHRTLYVIRDSQQIIGQAYGFSPIEAAQAVKKAKIERLNKQAREWMAFAQNESIVPL